MIALCVAPFYLFFNFWLIFRFVKWTGAKEKLRIVIDAISAVIVLLPGIAFLVPADWAIKRWLMLMGNYWLGIDFYALLAGLIFLVIRKIFGEKKIWGWLVVIILVMVSAIGIYQAQNVQTSNYSVNIKSDKSDQLNIALVADLHMGYSVGESQIEDMVKEINNIEDLDLVVIAGDIFDNEYKALENPEELKELFKSIKSKYGVYACWGNHDVAEKILCGFTFPSNQLHRDPEMVDFLSDCNIKLLCEEGVNVDNRFYLFGRADAHKPCNVEKRMSPEDIVASAPKDLPLIVLDHEPTENDEFASAGADLILSGHTHNGQIFPVNLALKLMGGYQYGEYHVGDTSSIVSSGVGVFGPYMRLGTISEVCNIKVNIGE
ncbi:MAG: metallophosphoesterase [Clostridia bacterium]|nr:metallophosphoesterase [Clostridia bacterium]